MTTTDTPATPCPVCGRLLEQATSAFKEVKPEPGDVMLCVGCASVLLLQNDLRPRQPTPEELTELKQSEIWWQIQTALRALLQAKKRMSK